MHLRLTKHLRFFRCLDARWCSKEVETANWFLTARIPCEHADRLNQARSLLEGGMSVSEIAKEVGYSSRETFSKAFSSFFGSCPTDWLVQIGFKQSTAQRVEEAEELLLTGDRSISEVSTMLGYNTQQALGEAFQRHYGMSPSEWLRWARKGVRIRVLTVPR